jgi:hypothetical protein
MNPITPVTFPRNEPIFPPNSYRRGRSAGGDDDGDRDEKSSG